MLPPIEKRLTVPWDQERAFCRFTAEIGSWWPLGTHSVGGKRAVTVVLEGRVGGRIVEQIAGGEESIWGTVTAWDPPRRVAFTWHPGDPPAKATAIDVSFAPVSGGTRLTLVHGNWEALGALAKTARRGYPIGWAYVLRLWADRRWSPVVLCVKALEPVMVRLQRRIAAREGRRAAVGG